MTDTKFSSERQPDNKRGRGKGWATFLREALMLEGMTEQQFVNKALKRALDSEDKHSGLLLKEIIARLAPIPKPSSEAIEFDYPAEGTDTEKIDSIISAVSQGHIPADIGKTIIDMFATRLDVLERSELIKRLERLEGLLSGKAAD